MSIATLHPFENLVQMTMVIELVHNFDIFQYAPIVLEKESTFYLKILATSWEALWIWSGYVSEPGHNRITIED